MKDCDRCKYYRNPLFRKPILDKNPNPYKRE